MLDFRHTLLSSFSLHVWQTIEFWEFCLIAFGCLWQLVHDRKFDVDGSRAVAVRRVGLVIQIASSLGGIGDSFHASDARVLFVLFGSGTLLIQTSLLAQWVRWMLAGRPS